MATGSDSSPYDVFLSHGSPDKAWVRTLYAQLTSSGVLAYLDEVAIEAGENFVCNLSHGIGRTSAFVIVVSQGTVDRPWVEHEWTSFMATHGPRNRIIPVLLDHVPLPAFLTLYQPIHAVDRDVEAVAARIARAVGKGRGGVVSELHTGQSLLFTIASVEGADQLAIISADGSRRTVTPPWRQGNTFSVALRDFEHLTRESTLGDQALMRLIYAAQTLGTALFDLLFSDEALRTTYARATAPGGRAVITVQSDEDVLLSLPWELLFHQSRFVVRDGVVDVVRSTKGAVQFETQLTPTSEPFTVVTHISAPEGSALSYEAESFRVTQALTDHCPQTASELGTLDDLVDTVIRVRPRGIHFSGHGAPGALVFENDEGFEHTVAIDRVVTELRQRGDGALPPFFFLASCHGNTPASPAEGQSGSSSSAAQLHREGVTEVVGYYGPIADELSTRAEEALYGAIAAGEPTRFAVSKARAALQRTFPGDSAHRPMGLRGSEPSPVPATAVIAHAAPFAWAQLVFYHRGLEYPLGIPASQESQYQREATLRRTYRHMAGRAFLATGFIGRRRELHQLRRRRRRGDRVFVLQGLGGLGKTTLAGHLLPLLTDATHSVTVWCRRSEGEPYQAEALVGQLLGYARARFGPGFERAVNDVDRTAGDDATQRFEAYLRVILAQPSRVPLVVYLDNMESLLHGPDAVSPDSGPDPAALGAWRSAELQRLWRMLVELANTVDHLYVVASCRYRNEDLEPALIPVSPLVESDLFRLMAWFPALRRLSLRTRARLAARLAGHPRAVEILDALIAASIREWENTNGEWTPPASHAEAVRREWEAIVAPVLPNVQERVWSDLLLATLWERVLDARAQRMLFRMTLLRRPWDDGLLPHLADPEDDADAARRTARTLSATSVLEQVVITVARHDGRVRLPFFAVHAATAAFVTTRFRDAGDLAVASHQRIGTYLEEQTQTKSDLSVRLEAGYHLFVAGDYDRAFVLLGSASNHLRRRGRVREALHVLLPFLAEPVQRRMTAIHIAQLSGTIGNARADLGETRLAIEHHQQALVISREIGDRRTEGNALGSLGVAYFDLGEIRQAIDFYEQQLVITREIDDRQGHGHVLGNLGIAYAGLGETRRAVDFFERQLVLARETGHRNTEASALGSLGTAYGDLGEMRQAIDFFEQQLVIAHEIADRRGEGNALGNLGRTYGALGEPHRAIEYHEQALVISRDSGDRRSEGFDLGNLGVAYAAIGEVRRAIEYYEQALVIARELGDPRTEGLALANIGKAHADLGATRRAIDFLEQGLAIGRAISDPRIVRVCEKGLKRCNAGS